MGPTNLGSEEAYDLEEWMGKAVEFCKQVHTACRTTSRPLREVARTLRNCFLFDTCQYSWMYSEDT